MAPSLMDAHARRRLLATGEGGPREIVALDCGGSTVRVCLGEGLCEAYDGAAGVATVRFDPRYRDELHGTLAGRELVLRREADKTRGSRLRGPLLFWQISAGEASWAWHHEDRRNAEVILLTSGSRPGGQTLVTGTPTSVPAPEGEDGKIMRRIMLRWGAGTRPVDLLLMQLVGQTGLGDVVRSRPIRGVYAALGVADWLLEGWVPNSGADG